MDESRKDYSYSIIDADNRLGTSKNKPVSSTVCVDDETHSVTINVTPTRKKDNSKNPPLYDKGLSVLRCHKDKTLVLTYRVKEDEAFDPNVAKLDLAEGIDMMAVYHNTNN